MASNHDPSTAAAAPAPAQSASLQSDSQPDLIEAAAGPASPPPIVDIKDLLRRLWPQQQPGAAAAAPDDVTPAEIADAVAHFFTDRVDDVQTGALLMCLHFTGLDRDPAVLSLCAQKMLTAAAQVDSDLLRRVVQTKGRREGTYQGGFVRRLLLSPLPGRAMPAR